MTDTPDKKLLPFKESAKIFIDYIIGQEGFPDGNTPQDKMLRALITKAKEIKVENENENENETSIHSANLLNEIKWTKNSLIGAGFIKGSYPIETLDKCAKALSPQKDLT